MLAQASTALVRLGDHAVGADLAALLAQPDRDFATLGSIAAALATVGDGRCIAPLLQVVARTDVAELGRAYAVVALGGIGDRDEVPVSTILARYLNYRATVETLTDQRSGVLDVL